MTEPPKKKRSSRHQAARGRRGGRPLEKPRTVPPASEAKPPKLRGGVKGTKKKPVKFPCDEKRWARFCSTFSRLMGKLKPACDSAQLPESTVRGWFVKAEKGQEPYRSEVAKALDELANFAARVGESLASKNPLEWLHRAYPEEYPRVAQDINIAGEGIEALFEKCRARERGEGEKS